MNDCNADTGEIVQWARTSGAIECNAYHLIKGIAVRAEGYQLALTCDVIVNWHM